MQINIHHLGISPFKFPKASYECQTLQLNITIKILRITFKVCLILHFEKPNTDNLHKMSSICPCNAQNIDSQGKLRNGKHSMGYGFPKIQLASGF